MTEKQPKDQDQDFDERVWRSRFKSWEPQLWPEVMWKTREKRHSWNAEVNHTLHKANDILT